MFLNTADHESPKGALKKCACLGPRADLENPGGAGRAQEGSILSTAGGRFFGAYGAHIQTGYTSASSVESLAPGAGSVTHLPYLPGPRHRLVFHSCCSSGPRSPANGLHVYSMEYMLDAVEHASCVSPLVIFKQSDDSISISIPFLQVEQTEAKFVKYLALGCTALWGLS